MKQVSLFVFLLGLSANAQAGYQFFKTCVAQNGTVFETLSGGYAGSGSNREDLGNIPNSCLDRTLSATQCEAALRAIGQDGEHTTSSEMHGLVRAAWNDSFYETALAYEALVGSGEGSAESVFKYSGTVNGSSVRILCSDSYHSNIELTPAKVAEIAAFGRLHLAN